MVNTATLLKYFCCCHSFLLYAGPCLISLESYHFSSNLNEVIKKTVVFPIFIEPLVARDFDNECSGTQRWARCVSLHNYFDF